MTFRNNVTSLRWRIIGWILLVVFTALTAVIYITDAIRQAEIHEQANQTVNQEIQEFQKFVQEAVNPATGQKFDDPVRLLETYLSTQIPVDGEYLFGVANKQFLAQDLSLDSDVAEVHQLNSSSQLIKDVIAAPESSGVRTDSTENSIHWAKVNIAVEGSPYDSYFAIMTFTHDDMANLKEETRIFIWIGALALLVAALVAWFISRQIIHPVQQVDDVASSIAESNDLSQRVPVAGNDEIARLSATFNSMLDRIDEAYKTQRQFVDDAGHELRTPITVIRGNLELLSSANPEQRERSIEICTAELDRMTRMVNDMLTLAVVDAGSAEFINPQETAISELTIDIEDKAFVLSGGRTEVTSIAEATAHVDSQRVTEAVLELVRNAVKYSTPHTPIEIASSTTGTHVVFSVTNQGDGIPEDKMAALFKRFHRGDLKTQKSSSKQGTSHRSSVQSSTQPDSSNQAREAAVQASKGAGLGLSIVAAIAEAHGGVADVESNMETGTTTFSVSLPLAVSE